jgi:single-stranded-DNA-specific exonuclease
VAPLLNENRWLLKRGLRQLARSDRPGLRALMEASGIEAANVDAEAIAYGLAPRLNAAGRLAHARLALELLLERDEGEARRRALELTALNRERQEQTAAAMALAAGLLEAEADPSAPLVFLGHEEIPSGIVGLVAGRLAEERYRPAVVYERQAETSRASCRSIPEFDITSALRGCAELLERFGGHRAAAGFTARNEKLPALKEGLMRQAETALAGVELVAAIDIDAALPLAALRGREIRAMSMMAPFGQANPEPTFLSRGVEVVECRTMGDDGQHLRLKLADRHGDGGRVTWPAVAFGLGEAGVREGQRLDVVYSLSADRWSEALELRVKDVAPAGQSQDIGPRT